MKNKIFIPMYIDKVKLFDINSIIEGGFNEFTEINVSTNNNVGSTVDSGLKFDLFKINAKISALKKNNIDKNAKYIQTSSSMLAHINSFLKNSNKLKKMGECTIGDFVQLNESFNVNSIIEYFKNLKILLEFGNKAQKISGKQNGNKLEKELKEIDSIIKLIDNGLNIIEMVSETDNYIYVVYLNKDYLYHTQLERIEGQKLSYLAQVINIIDEYNFCNDTVLSRFNQRHIKELIDGVKKLAKEDIFSKKMELITDNKNKQVVLLDIISICRIEN